MADVIDFEDEYSKESFWDKLKKYGLIAGQDVVHKSCTLFYCFNDADTPKMHKSTILGALGYLISPIDAIPDLTPIVGYTDDLGVLVLAMATVANSIKPEHKDKADEFVKKLFKKK